jgi:hypothetical protein
VLQVCFERNEENNDENCHMNNNRLLGRPEGVSFFGNNNLLALRPDSANYASLPLDGSPMGAPDCGGWLY